MTDVVEQEHTEAGGDAVAVDTLTDEELSVLVAPGGAVMMPYLRSLPEAEQEVARRSAYRSLLARGIVDPPTPEAVEEARRRGTGEVDLMVRDDVRSTIAIREGARLMVAVARTTATEQDFWYAHVVEDVSVLEQVGADGLHRFALDRSSRLAARLAGAALHPEAADGVGEAVELVVGEDGVQEPPEELLQRLGASLVRADVVVRDRRDDQPELLGLFSGPGGTYLTRVQEGVTPVTRPVSAAQARGALADAVDVALRRGGLGG